MNESQALTSQRKNHRGIKRAAILLVALIVVGVGAYNTYWSENQKAAYQKSQHNMLQKQLASAQATYAAEQQKGNISTASWKTYCDTFVEGDCFKYPDSWKVESQDYAESKYAGVSMVDPQSSLSLEYRNPYVKDGGTDTIIPVKIVSITIATKKYVIVGGYSLSSVYYNPFYAIADNANGLEIGKPSHWESPTVFSLGDTRLTQLEVGSQSKSLTTRSQANAWFDGIHGKTALTILQSFSAKQ